MFKEFLARLFGAEPSGKTAKDRLKLVLLSDHISLAPEVVEALKTDLLAVIGRYVEIDTSHVVVDFEHRDREIALTANVPILSMRDRPLPPPMPTIVPRTNGHATAPSFDLEEPVVAVEAPAETLAPAEASAPAEAPVAAETLQLEAPVAVAPVDTAPAEAQPASEEPVASAPVAGEVASPPEAVAETPVPQPAATTVSANGRRSRRKRRKGTPPPASIPKLSDAAKA